MNGLVDSKGLAARLGVSPATIRSWRNRGVAWLPEPAGRLDGLVWHEGDVESIKALMPTPQELHPASARSARSDRKLQRPVRRARGAYYTPVDAAHFMATWLVRKEDERYMEPCLGDGVFVEAVADVTSSSGADRPEWVAYELDAETARHTLQRGLVHPEELHVGDFLSQPVELVDGVIANPPYVRLRHLEDEARSTALRAAQDYLGAPMNPIGSIWMPFLLKMVASIKLGGRMAAVLPLDFTYVGYAKSLWAFLGRSFGSLRVVRTRERIFAEINQDVLILLADERGGTTDNVEYEAYETMSEVVNGGSPLGGQIAISSIEAGERAFQRALLPDALTKMIADATESGAITSASSIANFHIGYVSGDKNFFHPDAEAIRDYRLPRESLHRSLVNARKLRGKGLRTSQIDQDSGDLLWLPEGALTAGEKRYVEHGIKTAVSNGYKARKRKPWYRVPGVKDPDAIITVFSEQPMVLVNDAAWTATNSFLCAYTKKDVTAEEFVAAWYNPLTLLSVGLEVHSLGGGVVVMVPNEASRVAVLNPLKSGADLESVDNALRRGDLPAAYNAGTEALRSAFGDEGVRLIKEGIDTLSRWRAR